MILGINQTKSAGKNAFVITEDGFPIYKAESPWTPIHKLSLSITDEAGQPLYNTSYSFYENFTEELIPFKYLFTGSQKFDQFSVTDTDGKIIGSFYIEKNGLWDSKVCIKYNDKLLIGYRVGTGFDENVTFYDGDTVVGQLTKSNAMVANNKDNYMLHFIDEYVELKPLLAFFAIYYDFVYHNNTGEAVVGYKVSYKKSLHKNVDKYDMDFIRNNFGENAVQDMNNFFKDSVKKSSSLNLKLFWTIFGIGVGLAAFMAFVIIFVFNR